MGYRQYIGARYVPKMDGAWSATKNYEPLTVVEDGNGNSYTSRKNVPAGTQLDNREYWALTGQFSGAILSLQNRMNSAEDNIDDLQQILYNLPELQTEVLLITDSYGGYESDGHTVAQLVADMTGRTVYNCYQGGASFKAGTMLARLRAFISSIPDVKRIGTIVIMGGANDALGTQDQIMTGISDMMTYIRQQFPNLDRVVLVCAGMTFSTANGGEYERINVIRSWILGAEAYGAVYLTNSEYCLHDKSLFLSDNVHPNAAGVRELARTVCHAINGGTSVSVHKFSSITVTADASAPGQLTTTPWRMQLDNDVVTLRGPAAGGLININYSTPFAMDGQIVKYASLSNSYIQQNKADGSQFFTVEGYAALDGSGLMIPAQALCCIQDLDLYIAVLFGLGGTTNKITRFLGRTNMITLPTL